MFIKTNHIAEQLYVPYTQNIRNIEKSARMLATGERLPTAKDGAGELGVADRWKQRMEGTDRLIGGIQNMDGFVSTQDEVLRSAGEIVQRMSELSASALDTAKNTADRVSLDSEFQALENEFSQLTSRTYNGVSLFVRSLSVRIGLEVGETLVLSTISLGRVTFTGMTISQLASASAALISLTARIASLNTLRSKVGNNGNELDRVLDFTRTHVRQLRNAETNVRNIDLAIATGDFTKEQVVLAASQSALAQANGIVQSALQFLG